ncbi:hypothetical protein JGS22_013705 [Streptomyces sp. P38-E01]|uniref:Secreted protein n=1 Tax=Streptomyces tardus TaxID=2780544 RepID=A0A949N635_9ACTN|nr:DUF5719 family protein [Streptomyces tardus]MBU7598642.1 hypothetical protein [Streptomyces tardus]
MSLNRTTLSLIAALVALAAVTGVASLTAPAAGTGGGDEAARLPVQRTSLVCPQPASSDLASTTYTGYAAPSESGDADGEDAAAGLLPARRTLDGGRDEEESEKEKKPKPLLALKKPGSPLVHETDRADAPALTGSAEGVLAPGWTVQQTTSISAGPGRGLLGINCTAPDTDFWFTGVSTAEGRHDYVHLTNPDKAPATVDLQVYGKDGELRTDSGTGLNVPGGATIPVLLSTLTAKPATNVSLNVAVRAGRVGAQIQAVDEELGSDWIAASARSEERLVLPGIPADATGVRLVAHATGGKDAELAVKFAGPTSSISPAGNETLHVKSGMTTAVDLKNLTRGEAGSLVLEPSEDGSGSPVVATLRVLRGKGEKQETAFIPATEAVTSRATAAGSEGKDSSLSLVAPAGTAKVRVTASAGSEGGKPAKKTYTLKAGTTRLVDDLRPDGAKGHFAYTVERLSGGPVHLARTVKSKGSGSAKDVPMFTVQTYPDDRSTVAVPGARQDLTVLNGGS